MTTKRNISDWKLEQFLLHELPEEEYQTIENRLETDVSLLARVKALDASNEEILAAYPPKPMAASIKMRAETAERQKPKFEFFNMPAVATSFALFFVMILGLSLYAPMLFDADENRLATLSETDGEGNRTKGLTPHLNVYRKSGLESKRLSKGDVARAGDRLQLSYTSAGYRFGVIFSIDGRGAVTLHLPPKAGEAAELREKGETLLSFSYELDDAENFERFFFVTNEKAFHVDEVLQAARRLAESGTSAKEGALSLPEEFTTDDFLLTKEEKRR